MVTTLFRSADQKNRCAWHEKTKENTTYFRELAAYLDLFCDDKFATKWYNPYLDKKTGLLKEGGYNPWIVGERDIDGNKLARRRLKEVWDSHFFGGEEQLIGTYFLDEKNQTRRSVIDIDGHSETQNPEKTLRLICEVLDTIELPYHVIRSKGGSGFHVEILYGEPIDAIIARRLLSGVCVVAGVGKIEVFPKQDKLSGANWGNQTARVGSAAWNNKTGGSCYIDKATLKEIPYLSWLPILKASPKPTSEDLFRIAIRLAEVGEEAGTDPFPAPSEISKVAPSPSISSEYSNEKGESFFAWSTRDLERFLSSFGLSYGSISQDGSWNWYDLDRCPFSSEHSNPEDGSGSAVGIDTTTGLLGFTCHHESCRKDPDNPQKGYHWRHFRAKVDPSRKVKKEISGPVRPILPPDKPAKKPKKNPAASRVEFRLVEKKTEAPADSEPKSKLEQVFVDDFEFGGIDKSPSDELIYFLERKSKNEVEFDDVPEEVLGRSKESEDTEEAEEADRIDKLFETPYMREPGEEEDLPDLRPKPPRVRFKTQQRMRLYGYNVLRAKWEQRIAENKDKNQDEKEKEIRRCNGFNTTWNKITSCAQCSWRRLGSLGSEKNIPLFCERSALCIKCAEYNRKMYKLWTEMEWKDGYYTLIEKRGEFKSHSHQDVDYERKMILKEIIKPSGSKDMKQRYFEGYSKNVYIGEEDMYFAIRKLKAPKRESDLLGLDFHIGSWTTVKRLSKAEVIDYLFGEDGFWCEPAKAFFKINMQLDKAIFDGDAEEIQLKYMNQLAEFPFMEGWHKKRTNGNKSGKEMFPLPDKKAINAMCKAERLKKHPEEADSTEVFDNGALYWFKRKVVDVPKSLEKEWEKAKFIKDAYSSALVFMCKPDSTLNKLWGRAAKLKAEAAQAKAEGKLFLFPAGFAAAG